jgi:hypothetical protein
MGAKGLDERDFGDRTKVTSIELQNLSGREEKLKDRKCVSQVIGSVKFELLGV